MTTMRAALTAVIALGLLAAPLAAEAQRAGKVPVIGVMEGPAPSLNQSVREAFRQGLEQHGWVEGRNVIIEYRSAEGRTERFPELAAELVRLNVSVILAAGEPMIIAARQATATIPIVMAAVGDPVGRGFVASLARPGGNITGVSNMAVEMTGKWVELLKEAVPKAIKVAALRNPTNPTHEVFWRQTQEAARALGVQAQPAEAKTVEEIDLAFAAMVKERPGALIVFPDPLFNGSRVKVAALAERYRLPSLTMFRESVDAGGLMSYGPSILDNYRRAAGFVDRILKGAKPADMPVEQARQFELVINLKTAKALGLTIPPSLLGRADQVIE
jgi:putative tryptophan/tyrosine transport system substrate-binding protein